MTAVYFDASFTDDLFREKLYSSDIFIFLATPTTKNLIALAQEMLEEAFSPNDPRSVHEVMPVEKVVEILSKLKPAFIHHPKCKKLICDIMADRVIDLEKLYFDVPRLRSAYPSNFLSSGIAYAFHPHRDTWYSAPMCQLNWWLPVYPVDPNNAMGFYPRYFKEAVENNSEIYNYYERNTKSRINAASHIKADTREQPKPQQELQPVTVQYLPPPGGIILFSGAQLHETVPNTTKLARYSIDFRTVHLDDLRSKRGALNVDSRCTGTTMRDYVSAASLLPLPNEIVAAYDDETATAEKLLHFSEQHAAAAQTQSK